MKLSTKTIRVALEGGYRPDIIEDHKDLCSCGGEDIECVASKNELRREDKTCEVLLDPKFFQTLGKQQGWKEYTDNYGDKPWLDEWKLLIDHIAEGKDVDSFFNELLK